MAGLAIFASLGIFLADRWPAGLPPVFLAVAALAPIAICWKRSHAAWLFVCASFFLLHHLQHHYSPGRELAQALSGGGRELAHAVGIVLDEPDPNSDGKRFSQFQMKIESLDLGEARGFSGATVLVHWRGAAPDFGSRVLIDGAASNIPPTPNPGQFDYAAYLRRLGVFSEIHVRYEQDQHILATGHGNIFFAHAYAARRWMQRALKLGLEDSPEAAGLIQSMVLGLKNETPDDVRELFLRTGTLHLFVVNGLHVGMFAFIALFLVKPLGIHRGRAVFVIIPLLIFYAMVTGLSSGSVRATIMAAIILAGYLADRRPVMLNNLGAAAFAILLWNNEELFMPGFQFSFGVVFMIIILSGRLHRFLEKFGKPDDFLPRSLWSPFQTGVFLGVRRLASLLAVSLSAWIGSVPFTTRYFHLITPSAVLANLVVVPAAFMALFQGILSMLAASASHTAATLFNNSNWLVAHGIMRAVGLFAVVPGGHVYVELPRFAKPPLCEATCLALGSGDAIHLRAGNQDWLIDCGSRGTYENIVQPYLRMRGINRLDGLVLTHGDYQHIGGALSAVEDFTPRHVIESVLQDRSPNRRVLRLDLARRRLKLETPSRDSLLPLGSNATLRVLYPPPDIAATSADDKALALLLEAGGCRVLFMSDNGFLTERWLLDHNAVVKSDILVKGQHASDISGTPDFLNAVAPRAIVCATSDFPPEARIPDEWARDVARRGIELFREDRTGAVTIELRAGECAVRSHLGNQTFQSKSR
jgi:ComEC/Rec2-related protein